MPSERVRLLIVENHQALRRRIRRLLEDELSCASCDEAISAEQALQKVAAAPFDVALVKVRLPRRSGIELVPQLLAAQPSLAVIVLSGLPREPYATAALQAGAAAFVPMERTPEELAVTIRRVLEPRRRPPTT